MKIRLVEAELFHAEEQTDRHDEANSRISQLFLFLSALLSCYPSIHAWAFPVVSFFQVPHKISPPISFLPHKCKEPRHYIPLFWSPE